MKNDSQVAIIDPENGAIDVAKHSLLKSAIYAKWDSQKQFAEVVGIAEAHLSAIVNGKRPKSLEQAQKIAWLVNKTVDDLWPLSEEWTRKYPKKEDDTK